jgi:hypothetical protein
LHQYRTVVLGSHIDKPVLLDCGANMYLCMVYCACDLHIILERVTRAAPSGGRSSPAMLRAVGRPPRISPQRSSRPSRGVRLQSAQTPPLSPFRSLPPQFPISFHPHPLPHTSPPSLHFRPKNVRNSHSDALLEADEL